MPAFDPLRTLSSGAYAQEMTLLFIALALLAGQDPAVGESWKVEMTEPLSGPDFKLIERASRHPEMRGRDLSCYHIRIFRERGEARVAFLGNRKPETQVEKGDFIEIAIPAPNPKCPSRSFEMDNEGRVSRVIFSRH